MKENLIDIVNEINNCDKARRSTRIVPVARVHCLYGSEEITFWFTNGLFSTYGLDELKKFGRFVPKNSHIAIKMQTSEVGLSFKYEGIKHKRKIIYHVTIENQSDFQNQTISISGDPIKYQFRNINDFLKVLQQNLEDIKEIETKIEDLKQQRENLKNDKAASQERSQITRTINNLLREYGILTQQQEDLKNITIYIRKQGEMRYSLIVDAIQTRIKTQNIFDGTTLIIDGGPGTGKSTTMIHRLAYLTDIFAINEDEENKLGNFKLNANHRKLLREAIDKQRDWMFFSPSQLLKEYLAAAMKKEGLRNTSEKVWYWKDYRQMILKNNYQILESGNNNAPFKISHFEGTLFFQNSRIIEEFTNFYLDKLKNIQGSLPELKTEGKTFVWTSIAKSIRAKFDSCEKFGLGNFILLFNSLESVYSSDCKALLCDKRDTINEVTEGICELLELNKSIKSTLQDLFELGEEDSDLSIDIEEDDEYHGDEFYERIKKWLAAYCDKIVD